MDHPTLHNSSRCTHLRHKGMYVTSEPDPDEFKFYDAYDCTAYWCCRTQKAFGPDGRPVHAESCRAGRSCCEQ